jgi:hypothetical protein
MSHNRLIESSIPSKRRFPGGRPNSTELAGFSCGRFLLNVTGRFNAVVSAPQNPVSRKQRPTVVETRSNRAEGLVDVDVAATGWVIGAANLVVIDPFVVLSSPLQF